MQLNKAFNIILSLSVFLMSFLVYFCLKIPAKTDVTSVEAISHPSQYNIHLISYASGHPVWIQNQRTLAYSALSHNFKSIHSFGPEDLDAQFLQDNKEILSDPVGAGLWLWKPQIILQTLNKVPENDLVMYADVGFIFSNIDLTTLFDVAYQSSILLADHNDEKYHAAIKTVINNASINTLKITNCDIQSCHQSPGFAAGFGIYKNTPQVRSFVQQWVNLTRDKSIMYPTISNNEYPEFVGQQYDQTTLAITNFKNPIGQKYIPWTEVERILFWHHRKPLTALEMPSSIAKLLQNKKYLRHRELTIYNSQLFSNIRQWFRDS